MALELTKEAQEALRFAQTYGRSGVELARSLNLTEEQAREAVEAFWAKHSNVQLFSGKDEGNGIS